MNINKNEKFLVAVVFQLFVIFILIIFKLMIVSNGLEVLLRIEPVDPRDPLRGDYVAFRYDISTVSSYLFDNGIDSTKTVYVSLVESGRYWRVERVSANKPSSGVFLKGRISSENFPTALPTEKNGGLSKAIDFERDISIVYGIEQYFIPEGSGDNFSFIDKENSAKVIIDNDGNAVLKQVYVNDKPWP